MSVQKELEVQFEEHEEEEEENKKKKWCIPLKEDAYVKLMEKGNSTVTKIFGQGSFFSPLLFGKFFDPSDAFPIWEFESDVLLSTNHHHHHHWSQTDTDYVLKAELPGKSSIQVCIEDGKILEISGEWKENKDYSRAKKDWRSSHWWEQGYVRRVEIPENADWRNIEARLNNNDLVVLQLDIRIPKKTQVSEGSSGGNI